jgi:hypothetical protein
MGAVEGGFIFLLMCCAVFVNACFTRTVAKAKGYEPVNWFMGGLFFGPVALIAAAGLPDRKK